MQYSATFSYSQALDDAQLGPLSDSGSGDKGSSCSEGVSTMHMEKSPAKPAQVEKALPAAWIGSLLKSSYFLPCATHTYHRKNECTYFCTTCGEHAHSLCQHCISQHVGHQLIQVRRYVYCDVVRAMDIGPHIDTCGVQCYIINQAKVMFLNPRPQSKPGKAGAPDTCRTCRRHLRDGFSYCSLACKVDALTRGEVHAAAPAQPGADCTTYSPCRSGSCSSPAAAACTSAATACGHTHGSAAGAAPGYPGLMPDAAVLSMAEACMHSAMLMGAAAACSGSAAGIMMCGGESGSMSSDEPERERESDVDEPHAKWLCMAEHPSSSHDSLPMLPSLSIPSMPVSTWADVALLSGSACGAASRKRSACEGGSRRKQSSPARSPEC